MISLDYSTSEAKKLILAYDKLKLELDNQMLIWEETTDNLQKLK